MRVETTVDPPLRVGSVMVTVAAGTLTVWPPAVVTETVGTEAGMEDGTLTVPPFEVTTVPDGTCDETLGTETTVETTVGWPELLISVTVTVSGPDETGAGTTVETTVVPPLLVCSVTETVTAGMLTVPPLAVVTETVGWFEDTWRLGTVGTSTTV
jgi:hypothetical protein